MEKEHIKTTLLLKGIDIKSTITYTVNDTLYTLSFEKIVEDFFLTESSRTFFIEGFEKVKNSKNAVIEEFFQQMGQLLIMSSLSQKL